MQPYVQSKEADRPSPTSATVQLPHSRRSGASVSGPQVLLSTAELVAYISIFLWQPDRFSKVIRDAQPKWTRVKRPSTADATALPPSEALPQLHALKISHSCPDFIKYRNYVRYLFEYAGITDLTAYSGLHYTYKLKHYILGGKEPLGYEPLPQNAFDHLLTEDGPQSSHLLTPNSAVSTAPSPPVKQGSEYRLLVTSTLLSHKMLLDETYTCKHWAKICNNRYIPSYYSANFASDAAGEAAKSARHDNVLSISPAEITKMEREMLHGLKHRMHQSRESTLMWINWIMRFRELLTAALLNVWLKQGLLFEPSLHQQNLQACSSGPISAVPLSPALTPNRNLKIHTLATSLVSPQLPTPVLFCNSSVKGKKRDVRKVNSRRISLAFLAHALSAPNSVTQHDKQL